MPFTTGDDINLIQATDSRFVGAGAGNDVYLVDASILSAGQQVTITDTQGINILRMTSGLEIVSSNVSADALQLTLNNGATITLLGAGSFSFQTGGQPLSGVGARQESFSQFVADSLRVTLPEAGAPVASGPAVTVNAAGGTSLTNAGEPITGKVIDGYLVGATVFADANGNGVQDAGEVSTLTDDKGNFTLPAGTVGNLMSVGGTDISTKLLFKGVMTAPQGSTVLSPITTLINNLTSSLIQSGQTAEAAQAAAQAKVAQALGLPTTVDLTNFDPLQVATDTTASAASQEIAVAVQKAAAIVANIMVQTASAVAGAAPDADPNQAAAEVAKTLAQLINDTPAGQTLDLTSNATLNAVLNDAGHNLSTEDQADLARVQSEVVQVMLQTNEALERVGTTGANPIQALADMARAQVVAQGAASTSLQNAVQTGDASQATGSFTGSNLNQAIGQATVTTVGEQTPVPVPDADTGGGGGGGGGGDTGGGGGPPPPPTFTVTSSSITPSDEDDSHTYTAEDTITLKFSAAIDATKITIGDLALSGSHSLGTGATLTPTTGTATDFVITLGTSATVAKSDTITIAKAKLVNSSGTAASADVAFTVGAAETVVPTAASTGATVVVNTDNSAVLEAGETVTVTFSEAVVLANLIDGDAFVANVLSTDDLAKLGTGYTVAAVSAVDGKASAFSITLGTTPTLTPSGTLSFDKAKVVDAAGNAAAANVVFTVPADITAPLIASGSFTEYTGGIGASHSKIQLVFNEDMQVSDLTGVTLQQYGAGANIAAEISAIGKMVTIGTTTHIFGHSSVKFTFDKTTGNITDLTGNVTDSLTFYIGGSGNNAMNANGELTGVRMEGNASNDNLTGSAYADTLIGGTGNDYIRGGADADTFVFKAGDSGAISGTVFDTILDYTAGAGGDVLDLDDAVVASNASSVDVTAAVAGSGASNVTATILDGVITLAGLNSGTFLSLDQWLAVARLVVTADTHVAAFQFDSYTGVFTSDAYVFQKNDGGDLLIKLDGVTGIAAVSKNPDGTVALTTQPPANATPVLATPTAISFTDTAADDTFTEATGTLSATDTDAGDTITYGIDGGTLETLGSVSNVSKAGTYGTLVVNTATGAYTFTPNDAAIEGLKTPQSETFTVTATDGKVTTPVSQTLTINVTGVNDTATITGTTTGAVTKNVDTDSATDGVQTVATGTLSVSDRDSADTGFQAVTNAAASVGGYGTYTVTTDGNWAYTLDNANATVQALVASATPLIDTFKVLSADGTEQVVSVTINGADAGTDTTAPLITSGSFDDAPYDGSIIQLVFNEEMKFSNLNGVSIWSDSADGSVSTTSISADGTTVNIASTEVLAATDFVKFTFDKATGNIRDLADNKTDSLIFYIGGSGDNFMNANDERSGVRMEGNAGDDDLTGSPYADTIIGGLGADVMTGGEDADIFVFAPGSGSDFIQDWNHAETPDGIAFAGGELAVVTHATASAGVAAINSYGIATFHAADSNRAGRITAVEAAINAGGDAATGQFAVFEVGSSSFVFISDGTDGVTTNDVLIELVGITGLTSSSIVGGVLSLPTVPVG